ncbi:LacI family DNA-binding transcriptional regulator [soil metagenome]
MSHAPKRPTIRDVAALARVDASLVSRVLNQNPKANARPATRTRIIKAAESLGYQANVVARSLRMARTSTLGLLLPNLSNPMYATIAHAAEIRARERGFGLVFGTHVEGEDEATFAALLQQGRVDGVLTASGVLGDAFLRRFANRDDTPVVVINRRISGVRSAVTVDDAAGAGLALTHLTDLGHGQIAGIFAPASIDTTRRRRSGFLAAARRLGIKPVIIEAKGLGAGDGRDAAATIFAGHRTVTAIFASTFAQGMGVLRAAREARLRVPADLSVIALHDSELADYLDPPLTTIWLPVEDMARRAVDLLAAMIEGGRPERVIVSTAPQLVLRQSTGKNLNAAKTGEQP